MAAGADKIIAFDPPGAIGLPAAEAVVLLRFDESADAIHPADAAGTLTDLDPFTGGATASVVDGVIGKARLFSPASFHGFVATDLPGRSSLLTRDVTVQVVLSTDIVAQSAAGTPGCIIARGNSGGGIAAANFTAYALELVVVDVPSFTYSMRWIWQSIAGVFKTQTGAQFSLAPPGSAFTMLTATRRWISPTEVLLRYYIGDILIGQVTSADGDIGGGTTGQMQIGCHVQGGANNHFAGRIDELLVLDHEITREEIENTWLRITLYQPLGYQVLREMHDPGFPLPTDPGSRVQRDLRMIGNALGYAAAAAENVRANILPQRAYGSTLEDWEETVRVTPEPNQDIDTRRARVLAKIRQRRGCTIPGLEDSLVGLLGGGSVDDLEFLAFSNQIDSDFTAIDPLRWDAAPSTAAISVVSGRASFQPGPGVFFMDGTVWPPTWVRMRQTVGGNGVQAHALTKLVIVTPQSGMEAGIYFENAITRDYLMLGLRDIGGTFRVYTQSIVGGVAAAAVEQVNLGSNPAAIWLHLYMPEPGIGILPEGFSIWKAAWSTTSATTGFTVSADITHPSVAHWSGCYLRAIAVLGAGPRADFDDHILYAPFSGRPFNAYVMLDRALGFSPDIDGMDSVIGAIKHAFVDGCFITTPAFLAGDPDSRAGHGPTGGY